MQKAQRFAFIALFLSIVCASSSPGEVIASSTFDVDSEGWVLVDAEGGPAEGDCSWQPSGGNPGGFIRFQDSGDDGGFISAPAEFLGDWTVLDANGTVSYDHRTFAVNNPYIVLPYEIRISGPGGEAIFLGAIADGPTDWVTVAVPLLEGMWTIAEGSWAGLLESVSQLRIRIEQIDGVGDIEGIDNVIIESIDSAVDEPLQPSRILGQNFPNPFNPSTTIQISLPIASTVSLTVYDIAGRKVADLFREAHCQPGTQWTTWDGRDDSGHARGSGIYLYCLRAGDYIETKRMILRK